MIASGLWRARAQWCRGLVASLDRQSVRQCQASRVDRGDWIAWSALPQGIEIVLPAGPVQAGRLERIKRRGLVAAPRAPLFLAQPSPGGAVDIVIGPLVSPPGRRLANRQPFIPRDNCEIASGLHPFGKVD